MERTEVECCDFTHVHKDTVDKENSTSEPNISAEQYRAFFKEGDLNKLTPINK